jgi:DNA polymerase elongation subunit (family B)
MSRVVIDIETLGFPLESFDEAQQEYLFKFAESDQDRTDVVQRLNLYPTTARVLAVGMLNPDTQRGKVLYQADGPSDEASADGMIRYIAADERTILERFWEDLAHYQQFITFNGRGFDCPFLLMRSALLGVKPTRNLMTYRYESSVHCDLLDQFTFYGAVRKFNLDFYCKAFGIDSPKAHGVTGLDLKDLFEQKRYREIADYNLGDLRATAELFKRWESFLSFKDSSSRGS